jgi:hypothetical protein
VVAKENIGIRSMEDAMNRYIRFVSILVLVVLGLTACWSSEGTVPIPHPTSLYAFAQCVEDVNSFYVIGGADEWGQPLDYFLHYDASQTIWYRLAPLPTPAMALMYSC